MTTTAQTILAMTGARLLCDLGDGLAFNLPRGVNVTERGEFDMIYGDRLAALFTEQTGFDTHL